MKLFLRGSKIHVKVSGIEVGSVRKCICIWWPGNISRRRVNYPIKQALVWMQSVGILDMDLPAVQFCTSYVTGKVCIVGLNRHMQAWNNHRIPGKQ